MENRENNRLGFKLVLPFVILVTLLTVFMPRMGLFDYTYSKGSVWNYESLVAPFDFPILKTAEQINAEKDQANRIITPYYTYSEDVVDEVKKGIGEAFADSPVLLEVIMTELGRYYRRGVLPDSNVAAESLNGKVGEVIAIQRANKSVTVPQSEILSANAVLNKLKDKVGDEPDADGRLTEIYGVLDKLVIPNLFFDSGTTQLVHKEMVDNVSPTSGIVTAGDTIVSYGELITDDIYLTLNSYRNEFEHSVGYTGPVYLLWLGNLCLAILLSSLLMGLLALMYRKVFGNYHELLFIMFIFLLASVMTFVCRRFDSGLVYLMPFPVLALYYMAFLPKKYVLPLYTVSLIPVLIFCGDGVILFLTFLSGGFVAVYSFSRFNKGWRQFVSALLVFLGSAFVCIAFKMSHGFQDHVNYVSFLYLFLGSIIGILFYQLVYLMEVVFGLVSVSRLVDLTDTNSRLLRMLSDRAPGTFQHSLSVMNMVDAVGRSIDANVPLLRAAALYHDIGKMENPMFFVENQTASVDGHDDLSPKDCAGVIISHVASGVQMAAKHRIPVIVRDCIASHHGTTATLYFLNKYLNDGGDGNDVQEFYYPGPKPRTKEQVILMLCDSIEAASRTLKDFSPEAVDEFVHRMYMEKYNDGQFSDADISTHEIQLVEKTLKTYLVNMHHSRIAYPKRKII